MRAVADGSSPPARVARGASRLPVGSSPNEPTGSCRHPGAEELGPEPGAEEHLERSGIQAGHVHDQGLDVHLARDDVLERPREPRAVARIDDAGRTDASLLVEDRVSERPSSRFGEGRSVRPADS